MVRRALPPGFRFHPTDVELILYYLKRKIMGMKFHYEAIGEVNIYKYSPWDLPDKSHLKSKDLEWFFFCPREKKYASGVRVKRATENGYWKTTGKDRNIFCNNRTVGTVRTLIFHLGHAPQGERTNWVIHEYRILDDQLAKDGVQDNYVLCKVFEKKGPGPKNGAQYGAPFNEADWADDIDDDVAQSCSVLLEADGPCPLVLMQNEEQRLPVGTGLFVSGNGSLPIPEEVPSSSAVAPASMVADETTNGEMERLLGSFADEDMLLSNSNGLNQDDNGDKMNKPSPFPEGLDLYNDLHDLDIWNEMKQDRFIFSGMEYVENSLNSNLPNDNSTYIELNDLLPPLDFAKEVTGTHLLAPCQLDCSNGVTGTQLSSLCQASASYSNENMQQLYSETRFSGMNQYKNFSANGLALPAYTFEGDDSFDALQIVDHQFYQGTNNAPYNLDSQFEDAVYNPDNIMERGSRIENSNTRFMECVPSAAAELLALLPCTCGGSSMHIKAEVTRECTNDAFSVMMEGSSSCWCCNFLFQLWLIKGLFIVVEFVCDFIMVCCLNERSNLFTPIAETGNLGYLLTCYYFQKHNYMLSHYFYCQLFILIAS